MNRLKELSILYNGIITSKVAFDNGISRYRLSQLCKEGKICRVAWGQYVIADDLCDDMYSLQLRSDLIIFSHESALFLNGISSRTPFIHTVSIPSSKKLSKSISDDCKVNYIKDDLYNMGKIQKRTTMGNIVNLYDPERTICDIIRSKNKISEELFFDALKNYSASPEKNLSNLSIYATEMGIFPKVKKYMEVLL